MGCLGCIVTRKRGNLNNSYHDTLELHDLDVSWQELAVGMKFDSEPDYYEEYTKENKNNGQWTNSKVALQGKGETE